MPVILKVEQMTIDIWQDAVLADINLDSFQLITFFVKWHDVIVFEIKNVPSCTTAFKMIIPRTHTKVSLHVAATFHTKN